ncbi:MAG: AAA family ATPase [Candidatus Cryptobacteroides sp.]|nr:AAA family ATPase [Candidatus Cryptobacteroides sp.]
MGSSDFLYERFRTAFRYEATECQDRLLRDIASFLTWDDGDIMVVNGYAGTGKTTVVASVISALADFQVPTVLLAPTGRAAKVLSQYAGKPAYTIHKHIYRQRSVGDDGFGQFNLFPNKAKDTLFVVDEVSLIGLDGGERQSSAAFGSGNLLDDLISFVRNGAGCRLLMIGDAAQLPPVGHEYSPALSEDYMSRFGGVCFSELTTVVRQGAGSGILYNATMLRTVIAEDYASGGCLFPTGTLELSSDGFADVERIGGGELLEALSDAFDRYGEDETIVLCRSNKRANRYNAGIRGAVQYKEERLVRGDRLMVVKNCYHFTEGTEKLDYIANGDIAELVGIGHYEERFGLHFADARLCFPDYDDLEIEAKVCLDTLDSESASLTWEQQNALYQGVMEDYQSISTKKKRYDAVKADPFYNALQLKYANAITCHKSQGGQWKCVFIDNPIWQEEFGVDDYKWLYTAITRAVEKVYLVNFKDKYFI